MRRAICIDGTIQAELERTSLQAGAGTDPGSAFQEVPVDTLQLSPFQSEEVLFWLIQNTIRQHPQRRHKPPNPSKMLHLQFKTSYVTIIPI